MADVSQEYAAALLSLAREENTDFTSELDTVVQLLKENPAYTGLLDSPGIPLAERLAALDKALSPAVSTTVVSFLKLLCQRGRIRELTACVDTYKEMEAALNRQSTARVVSAVPLTEEEQVQLQQKLSAVSGHTVSLQLETDPALLGGVTVYMDGKVLDGSLKRRLHDMKEVIDK